jgi:hypothetical protein
MPSRFARPLACSAPTAVEPASGGLSRHAGLARPATGSVRYDKRHPTPVRGSVEVCGFPLASLCPFVGVVAEFANQAFRPPCGIAAFRVVYGRNEAPSSVSGVDMSQRSVNGNGSPKVPEHGRHV